MYFILSSSVLFYTILLYSILLYTIVLYYTILYYLLFYSDHAWLGRICHHLNYLYLLFNSRIVSFVLSLIDLCYTPVRSTFIYFALFRIPYLFFSFLTVTLIAYPFQWMYVWMNEWVSERMNEWVIFLSEMWICNAHIYKRKSHNLIAVPCPSCVIWDTVYLL